MKTKHLSPRALKRAIKREENSVALCEGRQLLGVDPHIVRHMLRLDALRAELASRPVEGKRNWSTKPGEVISALREVHGIGPTLATRVKRKRRLIARLDEQWSHTLEYLVRVERRVAAKRDSESNVVKARANLARVGRELEAARGAA